MGGIKAGIQSFIFPVENKKDYEKFLEERNKYKDTEMLQGIQFYPISTVCEAFELIFDVL